MTPDPEAVARRRAATALPTATRREIVAAFFATHPGGAAGPLGLGRAVADFLEWEISSGRLADEGGSAWWRAVNGLMVLDLRTTLSTPRPAGPAAAWLVYGRARDGEAQGLLWAAHQRSLHAALPACRSLLRREPPAERAFARLVVEVVDRAAAGNRPTHTSELAVLTGRLYPASYPVTDDALAALREGLVEVVPSGEKRYRQTSIPAVS